MTHLSIPDCPHCRNAHKDCVIKEIPTFPSKKPVSWTHYTICPITNSTIRLRRPGKAAEAWEILQIYAAPTSPPEKTENLKDDPMDVHKVRFPSGAERGTEAIKCWYMLSQIALRRYCEAMQEGATKYTPYNWLKGIPVHNLLDHLYSHLAYFLQGDANEDHLGHALWNLAAIIHYSETRPDLFEGLPPGCKDAMIEFLDNDPNATETRIPTISFPETTTPPTTGPIATATATQSPLKDPMLTAACRDVLVQLSAVACTPLEGYRNWEYAMSDLNRVLRRYKERMGRIDELMPKPDFSEGINRVELAAWLEEQQRTLRPSNAEVHDIGDTQTLNGCVHRGYELAFEKLIKSALDKSE